MNKAIFLDRDGTINVDKHYLYKIEDFELLPGVIDALQLLQSAGYMLIIITNQSGIARGFFSEEEYNNLTNYMLGIFKSNGIEIADVLFCPHLPNAKILKYRKECKCRKPGIELFKNAQKKWDIDFSKSYAIGDKIRDCEIARNTNCKAILLNDEKKTNVEKEELFLKMKIDNMIITNTLLDAAKLIIGEDYEK